MRSHGLTQISSILRRCILSALWVLPLATPPALAQSITNPVYNGQPYLMVALTSGNQSVTTATPAKILFNSVVFDSGGYYDGVTNFRYTPLVAGKYLVTVTVQPTATGGVSGGALAAQIRKNSGVLFHCDYQTPNTNSYSISQSVTALVTMNGTTDFIEGWGEATGTNPAFVSGNTVTWMEAFYVGP